MQDRSEEMTNRQRDDERPPFSQQTDQGEHHPRHAQPEAGHEHDPMLTGEIPEPTTGERRWASVESGAPDTEGEGDYIWKILIGAAPGPETPEPTSPTSGANSPAPQPPGDQGFLEQGVARSDEAYGQGETREFAPQGAEPGIAQQEALQSQQYEREERISE
jgi:hypothetical protein